jgi:hypothetical protein
MRALDKHLRPLLDDFAASSGFVRILLLTSPT